MIKVILIICYVFMFVKGDLVAATGDDIMDMLCGTDDECLACSDNSGSNPVFDRCVDYGTFNKDKVVVLPNGDKIFGGYTDDKDNLSRTCPMAQFKEECQKGVAEIPVESYVDFEYVWTEITSYETKSEVHWDSEGSYLTVSKDLKTVYLDMYDDDDGKFNYAPLDLLAEIKKVVKAEIDFTELENTPITLIYHSIRYHGWFGALYKKDDRTISVMPGQAAANLSPQHTKGIFKHPTFKIKVPVLLKETNYAWTCKSNSSLPCVSTDKGDTYFCSTTPCEIISGDIPIDAKPESPEDNTTLTDNITIVDNVTDCKIEDIILFPGKRYDCRRKGDRLLSNNLTSPNQCIVSNLDDNAKKSLLGGLNKFFEITSLGGIGYIAAPGQLLLKLFTEGLIENLADIPTDEEKKLSVLRDVSDDDGSCIEVGEYCEDWDSRYMSGNKDKSKCGRRALIYCCYDSPLAKAFNVAARDQIPKEITWGENLSYINKYYTYQKFPSRPNCRGITVDELGKINMDDPDFSEDMNAYVKDVLVEDLKEEGGMLDNKSLADMQKKMQDEMQEFYK